MTELKLIREPSQDNKTFGELWAQCKDKTWTHICWTLEDQVREPSQGPGLSQSTEDWVKSWKIPKATAIPRGRYLTSVTWSNRFQRPMPLLSGVPGFSGIRFHGGRDENDTEGCILIGKDRNHTGLRVSMTDFLIALIKSSSTPTYTEIL